MHLNTQLAEKEHIPGSMNIVFDGLSRSVSSEQLGLDPLLMYQAAADKIVQSCDSIDWHDVETMLSLAIDVTNMVFICFQYYMM